MVVCLTGARFTMNAEVLRHDWASNDAIANPGSQPEGYWEQYQDPITGEILNNWVPGDGTIPNDDPLTPDVDERGIRTIDCLARGIVDGGIRVAGSTERFGDTYENIEFVKLWTPSRVKLTKRDRVTNIRAKRGGNVIWTDEDGAPIVFNVNGVTPLFDAFNRHVENFILLERAEVSSIA